MGIGRPSDAPRRRAGVKVREGPEGAQLHVPGDPAGFGLNPTAYAIWNLCDGSTTVDEMAAAIAELTGSSLAAELAQVAAVLAELEQAKLID